MDDGGGVFAGACVAGICAKRAERRGSRQHHWHDKRKHDAGSNARWWHDGARWRCVAERHIFHAGHQSQSVIDANIQSRLSAGNDGEPGRCCATGSEQLSGAIDMQIKQVAGANGSRLWVAILASGEEVKKTILEWARSNNIEAASFVALGAFERATVAYFEWDKKQYKPIPIHQQVEVITLVGDVVRNVKDEPDLHAHTVLGLPDGTTRGGHLLEGYVRPTLEVTLTETPAHLVRRMKANLGIALIDID
jgi:uncharacterized protein